MADSDILWVDLSRFGVKINVRPFSPLIGTPLTHLVIFDENRFRDELIAAHGGGHEFSELFMNWKEQLQSLGFATKKGVVDYFSRTFTYLSTRTNFSLSELQLLWPSLEASDWKKMPPHLMLLQRPEIEPSASQNWSRFVQNTLRREQRALWTPQQSSFDIPYTDALSINDRIANCVQGKTHSAFSFYPLTFQAIDVLSMAGYRENALIEFFPTLEAAQANGWQQEQLNCVDLPFALPIFMDNSGRILAIKDVRYAPEALTVAPVLNLGIAGETHEAEPYASHFAVSTYHDMQSLRRSILESVAFWADLEPIPTEEALKSTQESIFQLLNQHWDFWRVRPKSNPGIPSALLIHDPDAEAEDPLYPNLLPITRWRAEHFERFQSVIARYVPEDLLLAGLERLETEITSAVKNMAVLWARQSISQVAQRVQNPITDQSEKNKHEDVGEKIGGARKDFSRKGMSIEDLESFNEVERRALVIKKNVWPSLDYRAMRDTGVELHAAIAIKYLKDKIAVEPRHQNVITWGNWPEESYISIVGLIRDACLDVKTLDDFQQTCTQIGEAIRKNREGLDSGYISGHTPWQCQLGDKVSEFLFRLSVYGQYPSSLRQLFREASWDYLIRPSANKTEVEKQAVKDRNLVDRELHRPHLQEILRVGGEDWRGGRDVTGDDLLCHFGFRAVEFGNWLPQDERQTVLNMAFDAFCDLSFALKIPADAVSLSGELAIAFGSRGKGGKNAFLAHYEPARHVINLTRINGAGALAHEWFHALDYHLGGREKSMTEKMISRYQDDPFPDLVTALQFRPLSPLECLHLYQKEVEKGQAYANSWTYKASSEKRTQAAQLIEDYLTLAKSQFFEESEKLIKERGLGLFETSVGTNVAKIIPNTPLIECKERLEKLLTFHVSSKQLQKIHSNLHYAFVHLKTAMLLETGLARGATIKPSFFNDSQFETTTESIFLHHSKQLDKLRSKPYWSTAVEMFARAGAQYVQYELLEHGIRSDYLVFGSTVEQYLHFHAGNPNPVEEERLMFKTHFNQLFDALRLEMIKVVDNDLSALSL